MAGMAREKWAPTPEQIDQIEKMSGLGLTVEQIGQLLGVSKATFDRAAKREAVVREALERGRNKAQLSIVKSAYSQAAAGNTAMTIFLLKTRYGYRETERVELTGADGAPLVPKKELTYEEAVKAMEKYERIRSRVLKKT